MSLKVSVMVAAVAALATSATSAVAQTAKSGSKAPFSIPGTNLKVYGTPRNVYKIGGTTIYQFRRASVGWASPRYGTYRYYRGYTPNTTWVPKAYRSRAGYGF